MLFTCICVCTCVQTPEEVVQSPGAGITGSTEPFDVSAGNQTQVFLQEQYALLMAK